MMKEGSIFEEDNMKSERARSRRKQALLSLQKYTLQFAQTMKQNLNHLIDILRAHFRFYVVAIADEVRRTARHTHNLKMSLKPWNKSSNIY